MAGSKNRIGDPLTWLRNISKHLITSTQTRRGLTSGCCENMGLVGVLIFAGGKHLKDMLSDLIVLLRCVEVPNGTLSEFPWTGHQGTAPWSETETNDLCFVHRE